MHVACTVLGFVASTRLRGLHDARADFPTPNTLTHGESNHLSNGGEVVP